MHARTQSHTYTHKTKQKSLDDPVKYCGTKVPAHYSGAMSQGTTLISRHAYGQQFNNRFLSYYQVPVDVKTGWAASLVNTRCSYNWVDWSNVGKEGNNRTHKLSISGLCPDHLAKLANYTCMHTHYTLKATNMHTHTHTHTHTSMHARMHAHTHTPQMVPHPHWNATERRASS